MLKVKEFFDRKTYTLTYVVYNIQTKDAIIIDPVWDYDQFSSKVSRNSIEILLNFISKNLLKVHFILETHAHADHLSAALELKKKFPHVKIGIGKNITKVQSTFKSILNLKSLDTNGGQFSVLLNEGQVLNAGEIEIKTMFTPGHTPACSSYLIEDMVFTGDALFMPDSGTGRCDFPLGSAKDLYHSVHEKLYKLPGETRFFTGHDYQPQKREVMFMSTIAQSKLENIQLKETTSEEEFVKLREKRDATLSAPQLLFPSIQVNLNAGKLPEPEDNGISYLKTPVGKL